MPYCSSDQEEENQKEIGITLAYAEKSFGLPEVNRADEHRQLLSEDDQLHFCMEFKKGNCEKKLNVSQHGIN